jgi:hypothetical protein
MNNHRFKIQIVLIAFFFQVLVISANSVSAFTVTHLKATYKNGQVFLTWKYPPAPSLKYHVYRSTNPINSKMKIKNAAYVGYVRDNTSKNIRKSLFYQQDIYFTINPLDGALAPDDGLYVNTCSSNQKWYYAVIIENTITGIADSTIAMGENSLSASVKEKSAPPQPVLQRTVLTPLGHLSYEYVIWGNNQNTSLQPAFNNSGSYGYNFTYINDATGTGGLMVNYRDEDPFSPFVEFNCTNCNKLLLDDWLPNGDNSCWVGYHEDFDMYTINNPVFHSGVVKLYTQDRVKWTLDWVIASKDIDPARLYGIGVSHNGFGALLTGVMFPKLMAAVWVTVGLPFTRAFPGTFREKQWGGYYDSLMTDVPDPNTGQPLMIWDLLDMRVMYRINNQAGVPFMAGVHGKNDITLGWIGYFYWYDSVEASHQGGLWYWDQRNHLGLGKNFSDSEAYLDFDRFYSNRSYPAFSHCSIDQDWGNGDPLSGSPFGALNGYLDWDDASINDLETSYSIRCFIKDMHAGDNLMTTYNSCTTDLTLRRLQYFHPEVGDHIVWKVKNANQQILNKGSFTYDGQPITLYGITVQKDGSTISFTIKNELKEGSELNALLGEQVIIIEATAGSYLAHVDANDEADVMLQISDVLGRIEWRLSVHVSKGDNVIPIHASSGLKFFQASLGSYQFNRKLIF